ncbi:PREDICTED: uncharacterized protein LOC108382292 [Rhagoletis zephyria]|uniref:uncharacterized protein LOC108382292 n=1 Tax=Rhagoletis zephyria TaxID=28612 RepID=UPI0008116F92|nr:PREDICTED: uncharacterized protein LOC108382292 [Rhagoletis zephyria]
MNSFIEQAMEKITDLQRHTRYCINNYDYYHKNNEFDILRNKEKILRTSAVHLNDFLNTLAQVQDTIEELNKQCDEVDAILGNCTSNKGNKDEKEDTDSGKENI